MAKKIREGDVVEAARCTPLALTGPGGDYVVRVHKGCRLAVTRGGPPVDMTHKQIRLDVAQEYFPTHQEAAPADAPADEVTASADKEDTQ